MSDRRHRPHVRMPSEEELALWRAAMRDVRPLSGDPQPKPVREETPGGNGSAPPPAHRPGRRAHLRPPQPLDPSRPVGLDRRSWQRLRRGRMPIEGVLDLHGMTQDEAFEALTRFVTLKQEQGARCVLVITGRGLRAGGVLRHMLPRWLETPAIRTRVVVYATARAEHGGEGAFYLLLRRRPAPC